MVKLLSEPHPTRKGRKCHEFVSKCLSKSILPTHSPFFPHLSSRAASLPKTIGGTIDHHYDKGVTAFQKTRSGQLAPTFRMEVLWDPIVSQSPLMSFICQERSVPVLTLSLAFQAHEHRFYDEVHRRHIRAAGGSVVIELPKLADQGYVFGTLGRLLPPVRVSRLSHGQYHAVVLHYPAPDPLKSCPK